MAARKICFFFKGMREGSKKKSAIAKRGEKTCVSRLQSTHGRYPSSAKGASRVQNTNPVIVIETVKIYFSRYSRSFQSAAFFFLKGSKRIKRKVSPNQIFDCAVKYNSLLPQWEYPSCLA